jgi:quercetin dioxygenase-like cupin family protein
VSARVTGGELPGLDGSALALAELRIAAGERRACGEAESDSLFYVAQGEGELDLDGRQAFAAGAAILVAAGEEGTIRASSALRLVRATVGAEADRHAPLGARERVVAPEVTAAGDATGARSFRILLGPHNGSTRATLFLGFVPPGKAPWHYHLYDEIVWVPEGPGRLHLGDGAEELRSGSAFRLRPREVHIVENTSPDRELVVLGVFTPAGSPSAAYLDPSVTTHRVESS